MENDVKIACKIIVMATAKERKNYSAQFKAKVALEAVRGKLTTNQIAQQFFGSSESDFQMEEAFPWIFAVDFRFAEKSKQSWARRTCEALEQALKEALLLVTEKDALV